MAKFTANGTTKLESFEVPFGKFTLRSDGAILRQHRVFGKLETATIYGKFRPEVDIHAAFVRFQQKMEA